MPDVHLRLVLYKRIASATTREELDELKVELIDRFGPLPQFRSVAVSDRADSSCAPRSSASAKSRREPPSGYFIFDEQNKIDPKRVLKLFRLGRRITASTALSNCASRTMRAPRQLLHAHRQCWNS